jgi:hypothetical protein
MIKLIGNKSKGQRSFTFYNAGIALKQLEDLKGSFEIIIKPIAENPTLLQAQKLYCLVNSFRYLSEKHFQTWRNFHEQTSKLYRKRNLL